MITIEKNVIKIDVERYIERHSKKYLDRYKFADIRRDKLGKRD